MINQLKDCIKLKWINKYTDRLICYVYNVKSIQTLPRQEI